MAKGKDRNSKNNGDAAKPAVDIEALTSDLQQKWNRQLSESFSMLGEGLARALSQTREEVQNLQRGLQAQSADTGKAVGEADRLGETLQKLHEQLRNRLSDETLQVRIEELTRDASRRLEQELTEKLDRVTDHQRRIDEKYDRVTRQEEFLEDIVDENMEIIRRYKPGHIELLEQKVDALESERSRLQEQLTDTNSKLDAAQRHNLRLLAQDDVAEREEIQAKIEELARIRDESEHRESLKAERDELKERLSELEKLRARYEEHQEALQTERRLEAELREEKSAREVMEETLRQERHERSSAQTKVRRLASDAEQVRKHNAELDTRIGELERELESYRDRDEKLAELKHELQDRLQSLKEKNKDLESEFLSRRQELERDFDELIATRRDQLRGEVEEELEARYRAELARLEHLETVDSELEKLRREYREAVADIVEWERNAKSRAATKVEEEAKIESLKTEISALEMKRDELRTRIEDLETQLSKLGVALAEIEKKIEARQQHFDSMEEEFTTRHEERKERLEQEYDQRRDELVVDRKSRIAPIHEAVFELGDLRKHSKDREESVWLGQVIDKIEEADFHFPRRLVEAFHTSLKISEWAPLTVLAGVSGTGKSELPRLYSMFGGLHHKMLSVAPDWDSPQDLFGFFNYMDNSYKATELLRALVQSQKSPSDGGFNDQLLLILLDEMNLARVELYFSEFLSKLEARRGLEGDQTPYIGVDIGSGLGEEQVTLGKNVLFVGTMNEDETTNALSDKVLDRGNVITFPRPTNLRSRALRAPLEPVSERLSMTTWNNWIVEPEEALEEGVRHKIREFLNGVNSGMSEVNRAIGHRVLQAIENYVANHPAVRASDTKDTDEVWQRALGDQVVQKVMPKLRGIETDTERGRVCLNKIRMLLDETTPELTDDFDRARESGYGSFIWSSATYLTEK